MKRFAHSQLTGPIEPPSGGADFLVVANRLPVDRDTSGPEPTWRTSPGGLVTALEPVLRRNRGAWIGWAGAPDEVVEPFTLDDMRIEPVTLSAKDIELYYEGFANATIWPLFHDVIVPPEYHRSWWDSYYEVNIRFAERAAQVAARGATVWVNDYQMFLVPVLLRRLRPDVKIGFFNHIPFPPWELFSQLPWRAEILTGLQGADLIGFQRPADAANFRRSARILLGSSTKGEVLNVPANDHLEVPAHTAIARHFPISVDTEFLEEQASDPEIIARAAEIRKELGNPKIVMLGVDRMDYTKGIRHRIKAFEELLKEKRLDPNEVTLVQIATPSRERLEWYQHIRHDVELAVGRINGEFSGLGNQVVHYFHHSFPRTEMTAFFLAADVCLVTALRDGMNLVAKEYVACRTDDTGALVLSEFTGAADQLTQAVMVNPHDITEMKDGIMRACEMEPRDQRRRMRAMRKRLATDTVHQWSSTFLAELDRVTDPEWQTHASPYDPSPQISAEVKAALEQLAAAETLSIGLDFDGVLAPLVDDPADSVPLPKSMRAITKLAELPNTNIAAISGRNLSNLQAVFNPPVGTLMFGSHGAEEQLGEVAVAVSSMPEESDLTPEEVEALAVIDEAIAELEVEFANTGVWFERKPLGRGFHSRAARPEVVSGFHTRLDELAERLPNVRVVRGHDIVEFTVRKATKGHAFARMYAVTGATAALYVGDDVTDEDAFAEVAKHPGSVSIKVGPGATGAQHRVKSPHAVAELLTQLLILRTDALQARGAEEG